SPRRRRPRPAPALASSRRRQPGTRAPPSAEDDAREGGGAAEVTVRSACGAANAASIAVPRVTSTVNDADALVVRVGDVEVAGGIQRDAAWTVEPRGRGGPAVARETG